MQYFRIWSAAKQPIIKHATMCAYMLTLQTHLLPYIGTATAISESDVQKFVLYKLSSGLAKKTVRDIVAVLKSIVKYGGKHKLFPYEEWEINYPTDTESHRLPTLSLNHQQILMSHLTESPTPKNIGILLSLCTGMRIGEVCALRWEDVDFRQKEGYTTANQELRKGLSLLPKHEIHTGRYLSQDSFSLP